MIDTVLECFLKRSAEARMGSPVVEILADTAVALASANVQLVARKIISKLCSVRGHLVVTMWEVFFSKFSVSLGFRANMHITYD